MKTYSISRYEEKSDALFICLNSTNNPVYLEHFFTEDERKDDASRTKTIVKLVAELELMDEAYIVPEPFISKVPEADALSVTPTKIAAAKETIITEREVVKQAELDRIAALEKPIEPIEKPVELPVKEVVI